jgi:glyoxylase-like metal-dependent hydrolase (beta-lactamase superfamily II)
MASLLVLPRAGGPGALLIDPGVLPEEVERLLAPAVASGCAATHVGFTHSHWDHVAAVPLFESGRRPVPHWIASADFPAGRRIERGPARGSACPRLDETIHAETALDGLARPVIAFPAPGHAPDALAYLLPDEKLLVPGDSLSAIEIPYIEGSPAVALTTLSLFRALLVSGRATRVVPGHGPVLSAPRALEILEEDELYLWRLQEGAAKRDLEFLERIPLPRAAEDETVRIGHAENVRAVLGSG